MTDPPGPDHRRPGSARGLVTALLVLALATVTAGCIGLPSGEPTLSTADQALGVATARGEAWAQDAVPVRLSSLGTPGQASGQDQAPILGLDGRAESWLVTLWSPGRSAQMTVALTPGGQVETVTSQEEPNMTRPLPVDAIVDSPAVMENATRDTAFAATVNASDAMLNLDLQVTDQGPTWIAMAWSEEQGATRILRFNATTGQALGPGYSGG